MTTPSWDEIWHRRTLDKNAPSKLAALLAADGLDTSFGSVTEENWRTFVRDVARKLNLSPGDSVFEVGCGAGAFLYELDELGYEVSGVDRSATLVDYARAALPRGRFAVRDAASLDVTAHVDAVVSMGVFMYFPSLDYAAGVVEAMAGKALRAVAVLDVPDKAREAAAIAHRVAAVGGEEAYAGRYAGLDHLYFDRNWIADRLKAAGLVDVEIEAQSLAGYENARWRFNAYGFVPVTSRA